MRLAGFQGQSHGIGVHPCEHEEIAVCVIRCDGGNQPVAIEFGREGGCFFQRRRDLVAIGKDAFHDHQFKLQTGRRQGPVIAPSVKPG